MINFIAKSDWKLRKLIWQNLYIFIFEFFTNYTKFGSIFSYLHILIIDIIVINILSNNFFLIINKIIFLTIYIKINNLVIINAILNNLFIN